MQFVTVDREAKVLLKTYSKQYFLESFESLKERDINLIDRDLQFKDSDILVKEEKNIIVIKLHYIRAIISKDKVYITKNIEKNIDKGILDKLVADIVKKVRSKNNVNWMSILRLAFKHAPKEASQLMKKVNSEDQKISFLFRKLSSK